MFISVPSVQSKNPSPRLSLTRCVNIFLETMAEECASSSHCSSSNRKRTRVVHFSSRLDSDDEEKKIERRYLRKMRNSKKGKKKGNGVRRYDSRLALL